MLEAILFVKSLFIIRYKCKCWSLIQLETKRNSFNLNFGNNIIFITCFFLIFIITYKYKYWSRSELETKRKSLKLQNNFYKFKFFKNYLRYVPMQLVTHFYKNTIQYMIIT